MEILEEYILLNTLFKLGSVLLIFGVAIILHRLSGPVARLLLSSQAQSDQTEPETTLQPYLEGWLPHELTVEYPLRLERRQTLRDLVSSLLSVTVFLTATITSLALFTDVGTLIWIVGFFTAGISFAAGRFVGDLLSGASIIFQDKLAVGEKIRINSQFVEIEGIVEHINLKSTCLRARTGELYIINNGELRYICNYSRGPYSSTSLYIKIASVNLMQALSLLNKLGPEAQKFFPELKEPWLVLSEMGTLDQTIQITLALKTGFGQAAQLRPKLMIFIQKHFALADIPFAK